MKRERIFKFDVFKTEVGTLLLEKEYDAPGKTLRFLSLKLLDYERHTTLASGDYVEEFLEELDSLIAQLQTIRQETIGVEENSA